MMYLSSLWLNPRSRPVGRDLANCHELHRTLMSAFPDCGGSGRANFGVLHRLETFQRPPYLRLLVQSRVEPEWSRLPDGYLQAETDIGLENPACKPIGELLGAISEGDKLRFCLRANPTRKIDTARGPDGKKRNGRRVEITGDAERYAWLQRKAEASGFELLRAKVGGDVPAVQAAPGGKHYGRHRNAQKLTFGAVTYEGVLEVNNPEAFRASLKAGIGPGKAYGFGLLSIAPLS